MSDNLTLRTEGQQVDKITWPLSIFSCQFNRFYNNINNRRMSETKAQNDDSRI